VPASFHVEESNSQLYCADCFQAERKENITRYNLTNMTEEQLKGYVNDNPDLWFYQLVYGLTFGVMLVVGLVKGIGIARQLLLGKLVRRFVSFLPYSKGLGC
jgi:hypothetical protein